MMLKLEFSNEDYQKFRVTNDSYLIDNFYNNHSPYVYHNSVLKYL